MKKNEVVLGERKKAPIAKPIVFIVLTCCLISFMFFLSFLGGVQTEIILMIIMFILLAFCLLVFIIDLINRVKSWENTTPLVKIDTKNKEFEFYSILVTSLKIKPEKIYKIKCTLEGRVLVYFYSEINQKLVLNLGFAKDAKGFKTEIKKYIEQKIK